MGKRRKAREERRTRLRYVRATATGLRRAHKQGFLRGLFLGFVGGVFVQCSIGCAHEPDKGSWRYCRVQCEEYRGPTMTWYGGPTVPPGKHQQCMDRCQTRHSL